VCPKRSSIETVLSDHSALSALDDLAALGCDRYRLLACLEMLRLGFPRTDSWQDYAGMEPRTLRTVIKRLRQSAADMRKINSKALGFVLLNSDSDRHLVHLPERLERYAQTLEAGLALYGPKRHWQSHAAKFFLASHVMECTGQPHDAKVSALISAATGQDYDAQAQNQWRYENYARLKSKFARHKT
jgi:hypothetical protein